MPTWLEKACEGALVGMDFCEAGGRDGDASAGQDLPAAMEQGHSCLRNDACSRRALAAPRHACALGLVALIISVPTSPALASTVSCLSSLDMRAG